MPLSLAAERERYAAFAFAVADLLVETDASGSVRFAAGAVRAFAGREAEALLGGPVADLVGAADRPLIERMVAGAAAGGRAGPALVASPDGRLAARVSAIGLGPKDPVRITFSGLGPADAGTRRDAATGLLARESFAALAERRLVEARGGAPAELTLLRLDGLAEADRAAPPAALAPSPPRAVRQPDPLARTPGRPARAGRGGGAARERHPGGAARRWRRQRPHGAQHPPAARGGAHPRRRVASAPFRPA